MVSKSKGFKLNGMSIWCAVENYGLFSDAPVDQKLFGQTVVSVLLHEIFHCIADSIRTVTDSFIVNTTATIALMASCRSAKRKREIATKYVNSLRNFDIVNLKNPMKRRALVKYMMLLTSLQQKADIKHLVDQTNASEMSEDDIDKLIAEYRKNISRLKKFKKFTQSPLLALVSAVISFILGLALMSTAGAGGISGVLFMISFTDLFRAGLCAINKSTEKLFDDAYKNGQAFEESWADMFAGIYNFPLTFYIKNLKGRSKNFTPNTVNNVQKLNELAKLEKEMFTILRVPYPTNSERNHAAAKLAENALKQKGLDPAVKEYLTWIKNNFSSMLETDIENEGISSTYDPNRAGDVDQHIQDIINQGNVTVTESFA
jgi:ABC-type multidrug transport system fused ATPase/permease subunit